MLVTHTPLFTTFFFFFNDTATTEIYTLSLHDALPISCVPTHSAQEEKTRLTFLEPLERVDQASLHQKENQRTPRRDRSEEHTSELQSLAYLVCRLLLEKKKKKQRKQQ